MRLDDYDPNINVEDQRGSGGGGGGFGGGGGLLMGLLPMIGSRFGCGGIVVVLIICWVTGINPLTLLSGGDTGMDTGTSTTQQAPRTPAEDEMTGFVRTVLADTEDTWNEIFQSNGARYEEPTLVLFGGQVRSACGFASSASGPFYCPNDQKLYLDLGFFRQLQGQLNSPGDFAQAYVIAHEVGHHVQNITGILPAFDRARQNASATDANAMSVRIELQADCYAGIWAHDTQGAGYIEAGDIDEALNAAQQIGDDTLQREAQGRVVPDSFTHGTSAQRQEWLRRGMERGDPAACDTFAGAAS